MKNAKIIWSLIWVNQWHKNTFFGHMVGPHKALASSASFFFLTIHFGRFKTCFDVVFILWWAFGKKLIVSTAMQKKEFKTVYNYFEWLLWTIHLPFLQLSCTIHPSQINLVQIQNKVENIRKNTMPNCKPAQWWWCRRRPNLQIPFKSLSAQNVWNNIIPAQPSQTNCCILFYSD